MTQLGHNELLEMLKRHDLLALFPQEVLPKIALRKYASGEYLCHSGQVFDTLEIIAEGRCKIEPSSADGKVVLLSYLDPLSLNGDIEIFSDCEALHNMVAMTSVYTVAIPKEVLFAGLLNHAPFWVFLTGIFGQKMQNSSRRNARYILYSHKEKLLHHIYLTREEKGSDTLYFPMEELASYLGITDRHLRRLLAGFAVEGILMRDGNTVTVTDAPELSRRVQKLLD